jgi:hypothetical protein
LESQGDSKGSLGVDDRSDQDTGCSTQRAMRAKPKRSSQNRQYAGESRWKLEEVVGVEISMSSKG